MKKQLKGFTLIELSIVIVIIGLIISAITVGAGVVRQSRIKNLLVQKESFVTAAYNFKMQYNAIPGDMANAQSYWGAASDCTTAQSTQATCNGTGNGLIDSSTPSGSIGNERYLFWKHLANAGLISGKYNGISTSGTHYATKSNSPAGNIKDSLWSITYKGLLNGGSAFFNGQYGSVLQIGNFISGTEAYKPIVTANEALGIDNKIDNGKPGTGNLRVRIGNENELCTVKADGVTQAVASDANTALYNSRSSGDQCSLLFTNIF